MSLRIFTETTLWHQQKYQFNRICFQNHVLPIIWTGETIKHFPKCHFKVHIFVIDYINENFAELDFAFRLVLMSFAELNFTICGQNRKNEFRENLWCENFWPRKFIPLRYILNLILIKMNYYALLPARNVYFLHLKKLVKLITIKVNWQVESFSDKLH